MAFPPNYRQERNNRERAKQAKALEKQAKRDERAQNRKLEAGERTEEPLPAAQKEE